MSFCNNEAKHENRATDVKLHMNIENTSSYSEFSLAPIVPTVKPRPYVPVPTNNIIIDLQYNANVDSPNEWRTDSHLGLVYA